MGTNIRASYLPFEIPLIVRDSARQGAVGFCAVFLLPVCSPIAGSIYGFTQHFMQQLLTPGVRDYLNSENSTPTKVYVYAVTFFISSVVAVLTSVALGFSLNIIATPFLKIAMLPATFVVEWIAASTLKKGAKPS